jgi:hypothetical protein
MAKEKKDFVRGNSLGASGFTLGIISILSLGAIGAMMAILGIIFCTLQQRNKPTKLGKAGLIVNAVALAISIVWIVYLGPIVSSALSSYSYQ